MRVKLASGIVNNANLLLLFFLAAACICAALIGRTRIRTRN